MLRSTISAAVVAVGISLAGCTPVLTPAQISQIQAGAVAVCGFLPTAVQVAEAIPSLAAGTIAVGPVVNAICAVVNAHGGRLGAGLAGGQRTYTATVNGVQVTFTGHFVNQSVRHRRVR